MCLLGAAQGNFRYHFALISLESTLIERNSGQTEVKVGTLISDKDVLPLFHPAGTLY